MRTHDEIDPDIIFLDAKNLPDFDVHQFEGKIEKPIGRRATIVSIFVGLCVCAAIVFQLSKLQIIQGANFEQKSENNRLKHTVVFSERGMITDRNGVPLAWNEHNASSTASSSQDFAVRMYSPIEGLSHVVGYIKYPAKDQSGFYYNTDYVPKAGVESFFDESLRGEHGIQLTETDVAGHVISQSVLEPPKQGATLELSIDSRVQAGLYKAMQTGAEKSGFTGGAALIMDLQTGELLADVTYPEYSSQTMTNGTPSQINSMLQDKRKLFVDRAVTGLYTPGSIVKPIVALGALTEKTIDPNKKILSTGSISIPNPYNPDKPSVFRDWRAQGWVDMREAIAVSSDVYFYEVGGGYPCQQGLGISNIDKYMHLFGYGEPMKSPFFISSTGTIPTPEWKLKVFNGDPWRLGDTYLTSIGQYGFQITPIQAIRALSAIATKGTLIEPTIIHNDSSTRTLDSHVDIDPAYFDIVHEGMRASALHGTAQAMSSLPFHVAGKTGTAELGVKKDFVNSWVIGFYPYEKPRYAFVMLMEHGPRANLFGSSPIMAQFLLSLPTIAPEYVPQ